MADEKLNTRERFLIFLKHNSSKEKIFQAYDSPMSLELKQIISKVRTKA